MVRIKQKILKIIFPEIWAEFEKRLKAKDEQINNLKRQVNYLYLENSKLQIERHIK